MPTATVLAGQSYSFIPSGSDPDGDPLTFAVSNLPSWAAFSTSTGRISGTPTSANVGTYNDIVISASDGRTTSSLQSFAITVTAVTNGSATLSWTPPTRNTDGSTLQNLAGYRHLLGHIAIELVELDYRRQLGPVVVRGRAIVAGDVVLRGVGVERAGRREHALERRVEDNPVGRAALPGRIAARFGRRTRQRPRVPAPRRPARRVRRDAVFHTIEPLWKIST